MSRSIWKGVFISSSILSKKNNNKKNAIKIWSRNSSIPASFVNKRVLIYNGKTFRMLEILEDFVGLKFGEFSFTRKRVHRIKKGEQKKKK
jgi:small subunit ribosomal protein S19